MQVVHAYIVVSKETKFLKCFTIDKIDLLAAA